jgi:hypothetical protein
MLISILLQSTKVTAEEASKMTRAIAKQVKYDAAPIWDKAPAAVIFYADPKEVPEESHGIAIVDTIKNVPEGVLGFHTEDDGGRLWGIVAADPSLNSGAQVLTGDWSVSSVLSHEVLEMFVDPNCNLWANNEKGRAYSYEVCDPVEAPTYDVDGVSVSNFVTPAWFDPLADKKGTQYDKLGLLKEPFSLLPGGYLVYESAGKEHQLNGAEVPDWRLSAKANPMGRTHRRLNRQGESAG